MYSHGYNWREEPEGTSISSVVLLLVFIGAAAFLFSMMYFQPWDEKPPAPIPEAQVPPAEPPAAPAAEAAPPAEAAPAAQ